MQYKNFDKTGVYNKLKNHASNKFCFREKLDAKRVEKCIVQMGAGLKY